jgi:hypothetical protein
VSNETNKPKAYFHLSDLGGRGTYRTVNPFRALRRAGFSVELVAEIRPEYADEADIFILQGTCKPEMLRLAENVHWGGGRVFLDIDDYGQLFPYTRQEPSVTLAHCTRMVLRQADAAIASTPQLADQLRAFNDSVTVVPSAIDEVMWGWIAPKSRSELGLPDDAVVLGCVVSEKTVEDLGDVLDAAKEIMASAAATILLVIGGEVDLSGLPDGRAFATAPPTFSDYLATLSVVDVALAPLSNTLASRCGSPIAVLEYGMAGAAVVAGDALPHRMLCDEGAPLLLAQTREEWIAHTEALACNASSRRERADALQRFVRGQHLLGEADAGYAALLSNRPKDDAIPVGG